MSRFEKISLIIAIIGLCLELAHFYIQPNELCQSSERESVTTHIRILLAKREAR